MLLEIFDSYRQSIYPYYQWRRGHVWIILTHVCRKWRAIVLASASRWDLGVTVGPEKPDDIESILSGPLPILIDYNCVRREMTGSALQRMHAALRHHDRVREITFQGGSADFKKFLKATNCPFPILESLAFEFIYDEAKIPETFLRGPDHSILHLRHLHLCFTSLSSISGFLLSATALTNLCLVIDTVPSTTTEMSLLACLQGMPCLGHLDLSILSESLGQPSRPTPEDIVPLSKLTYFDYTGSSMFLDALVAGLSAPSLRDVTFNFYQATDWPPFVHLSRFINEIERCYHAVHVAFQNWGFLLSILTQSEYIGHCDPRVNLGSESSCPPEFIMQMSGELSAMFTTVEDLRVIFDKLSVHVWVDNIPWRRFLQHFHNLKALRIESVDDVRTYSIARSLLQDHEEPGNDIAFLPSLEEIELGKFPSSIDESECGPELVAFQRFVTARQQVGRPVKLSFGP